MEELLASADKTYYENIRIQRERSQQYIHRIFGKPFVDSLIKGLEDCLTNGPIKKYGDIYGVEGVMDLDLEKKDFYELGLIPGLVLRSSMHRTTSTLASAFSMFFFVRHSVSL